MTVQIYTDTGLGFPTPSAFTGKQPAWPPGVQRLDRMYQFDGSMTQPEAQVNAAIKAQQSNLSKLNRVVLNEEGAIAADESKVDIGRLERFFRLFDLTRSYMQPNAQLGWFGGPPIADFNNIKSSLVLADDLADLGLSKHVDFLAPAIYYDGKAELSDFWQAVSNFLDDCHETGLPSYAYLSHWKPDGTPHTKTTWEFLTGKLRVEFDRKRVAAFTWYTFRWDSTQPQWDDSMQWYVDTFVQAAA